jgi:putative tricarboxylic transport membrane protein
VNRRVWIEGLFLLTIGLVSSVESLRIISHKNPHVIYDPLGPGYYLLVLSIGMLLTGVIHIYYYLRKGQSIAEEKTTKEMKIRLIVSIVAITVYLILINFIGYLIATFVFFILIFRIVGIRSWPYVFVLSAFFSVAYYFTFVKFCNMVFPKGILF